MNSIALVINLKEEKRLSSDKNNLALFFKLNFRKMHIADNIFSVDFFPAKWVCLHRNCYFYLMASYF